MILFEKTMCMVDTEALGVEDNAIIVSIGACRFNAERGIFDKFYVPINPISTKKFSKGALVTEPDTVKWWSEQSKEAIDAWKVGGLDFLDAMTQFHSYINMGEEMLAWGSYFDFPKLINHFRIAGLSKPWNYWDLKCARTIAAVFDVRLDKSSGVCHNALDDAVRQAELILSIMKS